MDYCGRWEAPWSSIICHLQGYVFRFRDPRVPQNSLQLDVVQVLGTKGIHVSVRQASTVVAPSTPALATQGPQSIIVHTILAFHNWALINRSMISQTIIQANNIYHALSCGRRENRRQNLVNWNGKSLLPRGCQVNRNTSAFPCIGLIGGGTIPLLYTPIKACDVRTSRMRDSSATGNCPSTRGVCYPTRRGRRRSLCADVILFHLLGIHQSSGGAIIVRHYHLALSLRYGLRKRMYLAVYRCRPPRDHVWLVESTIWVRGN